MIGPLLLLGPETVIVIAHLRYSIFIRILEAVLEQKCAHGRREKDIAMTLALTRDVIKGCVLAALAIVLPTML